MTPSTPPHSPLSPSNNLLDHVYTLQDNRADICPEIEKLTRQLAQERIARSTLENEAQLRELELCNVQQRSAQAARQAFEKRMSLEKKIEDDAAMHRMVVMGRNAATQENTTLTMELKTMEAKWKKELEQKDTAIKKMELASAEVYRLMADRDQLMQRTESDAKRVRKLWQQIAREHKVKMEKLKQELLHAQQLSKYAQITVAECQKKIVNLEEELRTTWEEKTALQEQLSCVAKERSHLSEHKKSNQMKDNTWKKELQQITLDLQKSQVECKWHAQQLKVAEKERDAAVLALCKAKEALKGRTEELLDLKPKFIDLVDKHEALTAQFEQLGHEHEAQLIVRTQKFRKSMRYAEELAMLWKEEMSGYKRVIDTVNIRLTEVQELNGYSQQNAWTLPPDTRTAKPSLCIYRH